MVLKLELKKENKNLLINIIRIELLVTAFLRIVLNIFLLKKNFSRNLNILIY